MKIRSKLVDLLSKTSIESEGASLLVPALIQLVPFNHVFYHKSAIRELTLKYLKILIKKQNITHTLNQSMVL